MTRSRKAIPSCCCRSFPSSRQACTEDRPAARAEKTAAAAADHLRGAQRRRRPARRARHRLRSVEVRPRIRPGKLGISSPHPRPFSHASGERKKSKPAAAAILNPLSCPIPSPDGAWVGVRSALTRECRTRSCSDSPSAPPADRPSPPPQPACRARSRCWDNPDRGADCRADRRRECKSRSFPPSTR